MSTLITLELYKNRSAQAHFIASCALSEAKGMDITMSNKIFVYTQIPGPEINREGLSYKNFVKKIISLTEKYDYTGSLIYHNHYMADPWVLASFMLENSETIIPLVATQPNAIPPHSVAKIIQSFNVLYNRKVNINLITSNNTKEIDEINDLKDHSLRYERMEEYISCLKELLSLDKGYKVNFNGKYYNYSDLYMEPHLTKVQFPDFFMAGSSKEALRVTRNYADVSLTRPGPIKEFLAKYNDTGIENFGIRIGIIAREKRDEAWAVAKQIFPGSRIGKIKAIARSGNEAIVNNKEIAELAVKQETYDDVYWMGAYLSGNNNNPYLIGSVEEVANYLSLYVKAGANNLLIPDLYREEDFASIKDVIDALEL